MNIYLHAISIIITTKYSDRCTEVLLLLFKEKPQKMYETAALLAYGWKVMVLVRHGQYWTVLAMHFFLWQH